MAKPVFTNEAPRPVGPYSQAIISGRLVFCSGQIGIEPSTGKIIDGGVEKETEMALKNLEGILQAAGSSMKSVIKCTIFLTDIATFPTVNLVYGRSFNDIPPARTTVAVGALPLGAKVEIEAVAELKP